MDFGWFPHFGYYNLWCYELPCISFCEDMFSFLLGIHLGVELLGHMAILCLTFQGTGRLFSKQPHNFIFLSATDKGFISLYSYQRLLLSDFLVIAVLGFAN